MDMRNIRRAPNEGKIESLRTIRGRLRDRIWKDRSLRISTRFTYTIYLERITMEYTAAEYEKTGRIVVWGSQEELARLIGCSVPTVCSAFRELQKYKYLSRVRGGNQYGGSNVFEVAKPEELEAWEEKREAMEKRSNERREKYR